MLLRILRALPVPTAAIVAIILVAPLALARAQSPKPAIATASVRWLCNSRASCAPFGTQSSLRVDQRHYACNMCFAEVVTDISYGIEIESQATGYPNWVTFDTYRVDVATTAPATRQQMRLLVRKVMTKCFNLRAHETVTPVPGYALVVAPGGIKFPKVSPGSKPPPPGGGNYHYQTIHQLLGFLNQSYYMGKAYGVTRPIHDATGLTGTYNIPLPMPDAGTNVLHELPRLGLEVKPAPGARRSLKILHIDHLTKSCIMAPEG